MSTNVKSLEKLTPRSYTMVLPNQVTDLSELLSEFNVSLCRLVHVQIWSLKPRTLDLSVKSNEFTKKRLIDFRQLFLIKMFTSKSEKASNHDKNT